MAIDVPPRPAPVIGPSVAAPSGNDLSDDVAHEATVDSVRPRSWEDLGFAPWVEPLFRRAQPYLPTAAFVLGVYAVARLIAFMGDLFAAHMSNAGDLTGPMRAWDAQWYLRVAQSFYPAHPAVAQGHLIYGPGGFEPVFPLLIRLVELGGLLTPLQAATIVSISAGAVATILVWRLGAALVDEEVGRIAAVLFVLFPGMAVVWGMLYSECVAFPLVAGSLLLMVRGRWVWAGVLGALATATSPMALPLALPAAAEGVYALIRRRDGRPMVGAMLIPTGFLAYVGMLGLRYHDILFWWHLQRQAWDARVDFGHSLLVLLWHPLQGGYQGKGWMEWIGVAAVLVAVTAIYRGRIRSPVPLYCLGIFGLAFVSNSLGFKPRFLAWAFPALIGLAAIGRRRGWQVTAMFFAGTLPLVFLLYTMNANYIIQP